MIFIDGGLKLSVQDNAFTTGRKVGLYTYDNQINVRRFAVSAV